MSEATLKVKFTDLDIKAHDFYDQIWQQVEVIPLVKYWSGIAADVGRQAETRLLYTAQNLLVRFECKQSETLIINDKLSLTKKTIKLWEKDVCEVFICPNPEKPGEYFEFEAAPTGEWLDLGIRQLPDKREVDWDYGSGMKTAAVILDEKVIISMEIPWRAFGKMPGNGEKWRGNLFRCVGEGPDRGYLAWQPTFTPEPNFHVPEAFGWFEFVK